MTAASTTNTRRARTLTSNVLAHANRVHAMLAANDQTETASRLAAEAERWGADSTTVVVAGDIKRGKSSLINALLEQPGLLPVDSDVATAVHLVVRYGSPEHVEVARTTADGSMVTLRVDRDQIVDYASMAGDQLLRDGVTAVDIALDHPLLARGLTIIDTPGVGGMTRGHRDTTMAALARADVLVFVVSLQEPVSRTELEFLAEATERTGSVVLVGTQADLGTEEANAAMVADLRTRLATLATSSSSDDAANATSAIRRHRLTMLAELPIVTTSAHLAEAARRRAERGRPEAATELRARSGIDVLTRRLGHAVDAREDIRLANLLQLSSSLLASLEDDHGRRLRAADGDSSVEQEMRTRREQLERAASMQARWRGTLATSISRLQATTSREVGRELNLVRERHRAALESKSDDVDLASVSADLQRSLRAAWCTLADGAVRAFDDVIGELLAELEIEGETGLLGEFEMPAALQEFANRPGGSGEEQLDLLDDVLPLATQTFLFSNITNAAIGALGIATGGLGVLAYGVGFAIAAPVVAMRRKQRDRRRSISELQRELHEALFGQEGIAREFSTELNLRILDARQRLEALVDDRLADRRRVLEDQGRELQALLKSEHSSRAAARREAERVAADISALREETDHLADLVDAELRERNDATTRQPDDQPEERQ